MNCRQYRQWAGRDDVTAGPAAALPCRYELTYTVSNESSDHERWLLEWGLDWIEYENVSQLEVVRTEVPDGTRYEISIEITFTIDSDENTLEDPRRYFERLEKNVEPIDIICHLDEQAE